MVVDGRTARSRRTRQRIISAAIDLFVQDGYLTTTIERIADHAGVAVQTVYYSFGTKRQLLAGALDASVAGDLDSHPLQLPWVQLLRAEPDPVAALELLTTGAIEIVARAAPIYEVIRAGAADPEVAELLTDNRRERYLRQRDLVGILQDSGHLRTDLDQATDTFYALVNEDVFQLLVGERKWDHDRYRRWVTSILRQQLLHTETSHR